MFRSVEVSWSVVCAACCHVTLVFAVMHLYNVFYFFNASVHFFFLFTFLKSGIDKSTEWSTIPACPSLMCFLTGVIPKGLILRKFCVRCLCMFCFMQICVRTDFVVYE